VELERRERPYPETESDNHLQDGTARGVELSTGGRPPPDLTAPRSGCHRATRERERSHEGSFETGRVGEIEHLRAAHELEQLVAGLAVEEERLRARARGVPHREHAAARLGGEEADAGEALRPEVRAEGAGQEDAVHVFRDEPLVGEEGVDPGAHRALRLGRWDEYLAMRAGVLRLNAEHQALVSNDLGAIAGFLFDVGSGRYPLPSRDGDEAAERAWRADLARVREESERERRSLEAGREGDRTHTEVQGWLRDLGRALGFDVWVAANDRTRASGAGRLADGCLESLPAPLAAIDSVPLIDVLWLERGSDRAAAAFEVEHTTSIYSGIVRMLDLASGAAQAVRGLYLVAPDAREEDVRKQLARPAFRRIGDLAVKYLPYSALEQHRESMARFGEGLKAVDAVARALR
jgi:hypothetical protein